ncbi:type III pantothenate kinase [Hyunsoonleella aestuarii]|uniref:Type III pantothenate kinase n=1 Tax=Hyunsoonleella aestuarii TaxID=912802 RepID=A0ABP8E7P5_9FLAO|nr:type III pantothenate kinase [Hyunsoonleella aestuarii]
MNLIIDVGNTYTKLAVFSNAKIIHKKKVRPKYILKHINALVENYPSLNKAVISSVGEISESTLKSLNHKLNLLIFNSETKVPFANKYTTPKTLGIDRLALVSASVLKFKEKNVLIIDAGSCITYDFIKANNEYLGGAISPGIRMRYKALNNFTANLPLLETEKPKNLTGDSTKESIHSGVVFGVLNEIDGVINAYKLKYSDLTVILTGGDAKFLSKQLKSSIFANSNFLLEGLNYILEFNSN